VLTTQNPVHLSNLTNFGSLDAGRLMARAWGTLHAVIQGMAPTWASGPVPTVALQAGGNAATADAQAWIDRDLPRMLRGAERC
jgi:hypothetical protein